MVILANPFVALPEHTGYRRLISLDRLLGVLAHTTGKLVDSAAHFEEALAFCRKAGYGPELA